MVKSLGGLSNAIKLGYNQWIKNIYLNRVFLLEMSLNNYDNVNLKYNNITDAGIDVDYINIENIIKGLEYSRYSCNGINMGYIGGDFHSWQRYTTHLPVDCKLQIEDPNDDVFSSLKLGIS